MRHYLFRRLLLIPLTLLGLSMLIFCLTRMVPGGPIEQILQEQAIGALSGDKANSGGSTPAQLSTDDREKLEELFNLQEPTWRAYLQWLGIIPRKTCISKAEFGDDGLATLSLSHGASQQAQIVSFQRQGNHMQQLSDLPLAEEGWSIILQSPTERAKDAQSTDTTRFAWRAYAYQQEYDGLLQGSLGQSYKYSDSVSGMIAERLPVSIYLGLLAAIITYGISLPLGVMKALWHKSIVDTLSSMLIFIGYAVPGFALGAILLVYLGARLEWFPLYGIISPDFASLSPLDQMKDIAMHTALPLCCYVVSSFAMATMMMKNKLMDELSADYVRTAVGKGLSFHQAVWKHALRNALIPIASSIGGLICTIVSGSLLIERVFDIQGFGLLSYQALIDKDYSLIMGCLMVGAVFIMLGNLLADIIVLLLDRRIRFD
ncbi:MAG: ABC transporter permease [Akkermansia sp.]